MGDPDDPEIFGVTCSLYVPEATCTVAPAVAFAAAAPIVQNGWLWVPACDPVFEQLGFAWSTYSVVVEDAAA